MGERTEGDELDKALRDLSIKIDTKQIQNLIDGYSFFLDDGALETQLKEELKTIYANLSENGQFEVGPMSTVRMLPALKDLSAKLEVDQEVIAGVMRAITDSFLSSNSDPKETLQ